MRLFAIALFLVACDAGCSGVFSGGPAPLPTVTGTPPPPVMVDAGGGCLPACETAHKRCPLPEVTVEQCAHFCETGGKELEKRTPTCRARIVTCSEVCAQ